MEKREVHLLVDVKSYYLALFQDTVDTDLKHITSSTQKLEAKILKCYPEKLESKKKKREGETEFLAVHYQLKKYAEPNIVK